MVFCDSSDSARFFLSFLTIFTQSKSFQLSIFFLKQTEKNHHHSHTGDSGDHRDHNRSGYSAAQASMIYWTEKPVKSALFYFFIVSHIFYAVFQQASKKN